jgi:selenide,water dikinase
VLRHLPTPAAPNLLVGLSTADDAGVYRLSDDLALVQTVDFITPIVDDPYAFGAIAAANATSDVYAMGGQPLTALNLLAYPTSALDPEIVAEILRGGADKLHEAGVVVVGGHTIDDAEPKYGAALTGTIHPQRIVTNAAAQAGDMLLLTKPLGTGIISTAIKAERAPEAVAAAAVASMVRLNAAASAAMLEVGVHAATDVTGFGLLGHLREMLAASGVGAELYAGAVPVLPGTLDLLAQNYVPGGSRRNLDSVRAWVTLAPDVPPHIPLLLADAQTSGGLLIAVPAERTEQLRAALQARGTPAAIIGQLTRDHPGAITVRWSREVE